MALDLDVDLDLDLDLDLNLHLDLDPDLPPYLYQGGEGGVSLFATPRGGEEEGEEEVPRRLLTPLGSADTTG